MAGNLVLGILTLLFFGSVVRGEDYIVGGEDAKPGQIPWQAFLATRKFDGSLSKCGGTVLSPRHVLTATHCVAHRDPKGRIRYATADNINVYLGSNKAGRGSRFAVQEVKTHELYSNQGDGILNDIALLTLKKRVTYNKNIQGACLPDRPATDYSLSKVTVSGWGLRKTNGTLAEDLQVLNLTVRTSCDRSFPGQFCAGGAANRDTCDGDSGGPAIAMEDCPTLIGITSFVFGDKPCGTEGSPGHYTEVYHYLDWLCNAGLDAACKENQTDNLLVEFLLGFF